MTMLEFQTSVVVVVANGKETYCNPQSVNLQQYYL